METQTTPDLLSPGELAHLLRKSVQTINRMGDAGAFGELAFTSGGQRRYSRAGIRAYAAGLRAEAEKLEAAAQ